VQHPASVPIAQPRPTVKPVVVKHEPAPVVVETVPVAHDRTKPVAIPRADVAPVKHQDNPSVQPNKPVPARVSETLGKGKGNNKQRPTKPVSKPKNAEEPQATSEKKGVPQ
jgi:hypothetical protein